MKKLNDTIKQELSTKKSEYKEFYKMISNNTMYTSLKQLEESDPYIFSMYCEYFRNIVRSEFYSDKSRHYKEKNYETGELEDKTTCTYEIVNTLFSSTEYSHDYKNLVQLVTDLLISKDYEKDCFLFGTKDANHSLNKISISVFHQAIDLYRKTRKTKLDVSIETPIANPNDSEDSFTISDTLVSEEYNPDDTYLDHENQLETNIKTYECLKNLSKKRYIGQSYVFIEDVLKSQYEPYSLDSVLAIFNNIGSKTPKYQELAKKAVVRYYNKDLVRFFECISTDHINDEATEFILTHYGKSLNDFGKDFGVTADEFYHLRSRNKEDLSKFLGVELPRKYKKTR